MANAGFLVNCSPRISYFPPRQTRLRKRSTAHTLLSTCFPSLPIQSSPDWSLSPVVTHSRSRRHSKHQSGRLAPQEPGAVIPPKHFHNLTLDICCRRLSEDLQSGRNTSQSKRGRFNSNRNCPPQEHHRRSGENSRRSQFQHNRLQLQVHHRPHLVPGPHQSSSLRRRLRTTSAGYPHRPAKGLELIYILQISNSRS
jgi:hypothetical protein